MIAALQSENAQLRGALRAVSTASFRSPERYCRANPFLTAWGDAEFSAAAEGTVAFMGSQNALSLERKWHAPNHERFDAAPGVAAGAACKDLARYPADANVDDGAKWLCGLRQLQPGCVIYSLGSNYDFSFEYLMIDNTPCSVHTFDCTVIREDARFPRDFEARGRGRLTFHKTCLGNQDDDSAGGVFLSLRAITQKLDHARVDLIKMDIEGYEYRVVEALFADALAQRSSSDNMHLPMQFSFELHTRLSVGLSEKMVKTIGDKSAADSGAMPDSAALAAPPVEGDTRDKWGWWDRGGLSAGDMQIFWSALTHLGYTVVSREDNPGCKCGSEFTVVRSFC
jgi:hypothetical protein